MDIEMENIPSAYSYEDKWALTAKHVKYMKCIPEWKAFISFCLMWSTTMAHPNLINHSEPNPTKWNISSKLDLGLYIKVISEKEPENFEFEYDSKLAQFPNEPDFKFKISINNCSCPKPFYRLIDALRQTIAYELGSLSCKSFLTPYNLCWDKSEEPYILKINTKQD